VSINDERINKELQKAIKKIGTLPIEEAFWILIPVNPHEDANWIKAIGGKDEIFSRIRQHCTVYYEPTEEDKDKLIIAMQKASCILHVHNHPFHNHPDSSRKKEPLVPSPNDLGFAAHWKSVRSEFSKKMKFFIVRGNNIVEYSSLQHDNDGLDLSYIENQDEFLLNKAVQGIILTNAMKYGNLSKVKKLLKEGSDVNGKDEYGSPALHIALLYKHKGIVKQLIKKGADVNAKNFFGATALQVASHLGQTDMVKLLIKKGADVNAKDYHGNTALIVATEARNRKIVKVLLKNGADVHEKDNNAEMGSILYRLSENTKR